jgi:adenylate kinase
MIGAPGAGKGTQGVRVAAHYGIAHISSGDLLREHITTGSSIGRAARGFVEGGDLVPDAVVLDMLRKPIVAASEQGGYVLDGFPRTVEQAVIAYDVAKDLGVEVQTAVHLDVPRDELVRRLLARGRGTDDSRDVIEHRLAVYESKTLPMLEYYAQRETVVVVDGAQPADAVTIRLLAQLEHQRRIRR